MHLFSGRAFAILAFQTGPLCFFRTPYLLSLILPTMVNELLSCGGDGSSPPFPLFLTPTNHGVGGGFLPASEPPPPKSFV